MVLHLLLMYGIAVQGLQAFKWTSPIPDGDVIYACQGATVSLPWHIQTGPDDVISVIQWFYSGHSEEVVAVFTHGVFVTFPAFADRVTHVDDASITLGPVIPADSGNYTVQVTGSSVAGHHYELRQTVYVQISVLHHISTRIRLVGGRNAREGRVEIVVGGNWGTVCDDDWDSRDAQVVCNMLGYTAPGAAAKVSAAFWEVAGAIVMDDVNCHGNETDIKLCQTRDLGTHNCGHGEDAGVICVG
ncbi:hypothetical protein ACOMHN_021908 [Nucella lapillus]